MGKIYLPEGYRSLLTAKETEQAIKLIKDNFQHELAYSLKLSRVTAPLFVEAGTGINDDLNGTERPVSFRVPALENRELQIVQSLAKWKRMALAELEIEPGRGIYTDMNALRPDEELSDIHSIYVDQWDWEKSILPEQRNLEYLRQTVETIYDAMKRLEFLICETYQSISEVLPPSITFIHSEDLQKEYPRLTPKERENMAAKKYGAIFIIGIGKKIAGGEPHDGRAPDYDDWSTPTINGYSGLNGDIILWNPVLKRAFEVSSMGIRVTPEAMLYQLKEAGREERKSLLFHRRLINGELPASIGGGIGQSRLCMFMLRKAHIGEVQASVWPGEHLEACSVLDVRML